MVRAPKRLGNFIFSLVIAGNSTRTLSLITLPVLLMAFLVQKHIVRGLTIGALKG